MGRDSLRRIVPDVPAREARAGNPASIAIGADHGGYTLKERLKTYIEEELGLVAVDCGAFSAGPVDYPDIAAEVAARVASGECGRGILIDGAGIGSAIAANKFEGVRAAVANEDRSARSSREHNDTNVLCLGASLIPTGQARRLVRLWLATPFAGGRHQRRVDKINELDRTRGKRSATA